MKLEGPHICTAQTQGGFARCFEEVAQLLAASFADLGFSPTVAENRLQAGCTNILLGYHLVEDPSRLAGLDYVVFQLEQLSASPERFDERIATVLSGARRIWDFSGKNIAFLERRGIPADWLPLGHHPSLERLCPAGSRDEDIDVLFYGVLTNRRGKVLLELEAMGLKVEALFGVYGQERDAYIERSKIVLNCHAYPPRILEAVRLAYLAGNGRFVVSEEAGENPYTDLGMVFTRYEALAETCRFFVDNPDVRIRRAKGAQESFRRDMPMTALLARVLEAS